MSLKMEEFEIGTDFERPSGVSVALTVSSAECRARADMYRMLSGAFIEEPSAPYLQALRGAASLDHLGRAGIVFGKDFLDAEMPALVDALACEYATLFASSGGFPPVESVRLTGRFKQDPHFLVDRTYREWGFCVVKGRFEVFPDHLGAELLFAAALLDRCAAALDEENGAAYRAAEKALRRFWVQHPGRWVRGYAGLIERASNHSFFRQMARLLAGFAQEEMDAMGLVRVDDLDQGRIEVPKADIQLEFNPDEPVCGECNLGGEGRTPTHNSGSRVVPIRALNDLSL